MNVKDDAHVPSAPARVRRAALPLLLALVAVAAAAGWPLAELPLWRVRLDGAARLDSPSWTASGVRRVNDGSAAVLTGGSAARVEGAAAALAARRDPGTDALADAARGFVADALARGSAAIAEPLNEREATVAMLLARAALLEALPRRLPEPYRAGSAPVAFAPPLSLLAAGQDIELSAEAGDLVLLAGGFARAQAAEARWFGSGVPSSDASAAIRGRAWRDWQASRSAAMRRLASATLASLSERQVERVRGALPAYLASQAEDVAGSLEALGRGGQPLVVPAASPVVAVWLAWLALAAFAGAWLGAAISAALARRHAAHPARAARLVLAHRRGPAQATASLHVIAGHTPRNVARGVLELTAHALAAGRRVLVIESSLKLGLHAVLDREARWGLAECLSADMPMLGLVQFGGRPGLYFLAHGSADRRPLWSALGQRLDDIEPHFDQVVLALGPDAPRELGDAIVGRSLEGWWVGSGDRLPQAAERLGDRLSMAFSCMDLGAVSEPSLEALGRRIEALRGESQAARILAPVVREAPRVEPAPEPFLEPVILDCDLQIQARLRFLAWMRQVEKESRRQRQPEFASATQG